MCRLYYSFNLYVGFNFVKIKRAETGKVYFKVIITEIYNENVNLKIKGLSN